MGTVRAGGVRLPWAQLPDRVRAAVEAWAGSAVIEAVNAPTGFSPGVAARLAFADGSRAFCKAVGTELNPESPPMHRREAAVAGVLPLSAPVPRLRHVYDEGDWVALVFDEVDGRHPVEPWDPAELAAVLDALSRLAVELTPSPLPQLPTFAELHGASFGGWAALAAAPPADLSDFERRHLDRLAGLESGWAEASAGETLLHSDVRADNLLLRPNGSVVLVDWPWACRGAEWADLALFLPNVALLGGPEPEDVLVGLPVLRAAEPDAVTALVVGLAGLFARSCRKPDPPGLPTLRAFQAAQLRVTLAWIAARTGWR